MRVLITGGTGFIGSALCRHYLDEGHEVRALAKLATSAEMRNGEKLREAGVDLVVGDVGSRETIARASDGVDLVHHVAAAMREANVGREFYWQVNVEGTRYVLEEAARAGASQVVYCSSVGVYGDISGRRVDEESRCRPTNHYGETKLAAEALVKEFTGREQLPVVIVRPAEVYGPGDARLLKLFRMIQDRKFILFGRGEGKHHLVYIEDLVAAMALAGRRPELSGQTFVLAGEEPIELRKMIRLIAEVLDVEPPWRSLPLAPVMLAARIIEAVCRPLGIQPPIYPRRMDFFRHDWHFDISRCKETLGYTPRFDLRSGLERTITGYTESSSLKAVGQRR